jgi:hypothetical protein
MGTCSIAQIPRISLILLVGFQCASASSTKKAQWLRLLDWKTGILWEAPNACDETSRIYKETFLILGDDIVYHVAHIAVLHKPNITEGQSVRYTVALGGLYLQDENNRVFKLALVKSELDPRHYALRPTPPTASRRTLRSPARRGAASRPYPSGGEVFGCLRHRG